jgi:hypothetical protein
MDTAAPSQRLLLTDDLETSADGQRFSMTLRLSPGPDVRLELGPQELAALIADGLQLAAQAPSGTTTSATHPLPLAFLQVSVQTVGDGTPLLLLQCGPVALAAVLSSMLARQTGEKLLMLSATARESSPPN